MNYPDFELGLERGVFSMQSTYWIVDYRFDMDNLKTIRHVSPTEVFVFDKRIIPTANRIYYSNYYFRRVGKSGKPLKGIIQTYGYQPNGYGGIHVSAFKKAAEEFYKTQCEEALESVKMSRILMLDKLDELQYTAQKRLANCP